MIRWGIQEGLKSCPFMCPVWRWRWRKIFVSEGLYKKLSLYQFGKKMQVWIVSEGLQMITLKLQEGLKKLSLYNVQYENRSSSRQLLYTAKRRSFISSEWKWKCETATRTYKCYLLIRTNPREDWYVHSSLNCTKTYKLKYYA